MLQTAAVPLFGVTVICEVLVFIDVFSPMLDIVMENAYFAVAPGSPVIAAPLLVLTEFAVYVEGRLIPILSVPVSVNVSFDEFEYPDIVTLPPVLGTVAVESIVTNSDAPDCTIVRVFDSTPDAENVAVVVLAERPVCSEPVHETVSFPEPLVLLGVTHDAYAILYIFS